MQTTKMPQALRRGHRALHSSLAWLLSFQLVHAALPLSKKPVLLPNPALGRLDPVLQGIVLVRFRSDHVSPRLQTIPPLPLTNLRVEPLLRWEQSLHAGVQRSPLSLTQRSTALQAEEALLRTFVLEYAEPWEPEYVCKLLQSRCPAVEYAEPYVLATPFFTPNDPLLPRQQLLWTINAFAAWDLGQGDSAVVIGIVDTGVRFTHEDLIGSLWFNRAEIPNNGVDDDGNGYVDDYLGYNFTAAEDGRSPGDPRNITEGHGTGVAGIAAATVNNAKGLAGVGFRCRFFPLKASPEGVPAIYYGYQGILYCALMGFAVANCSWGSLTYSCTQQTIITYALARGTLVVAAAGNSPVSTRTWYPAGYPGVLGVGNTYPNDMLHPLSARGLGTQVLAPGESAWTTGNDADNAYTTFGGTSGAAPIVSAAAALLHALRPGLSPMQVMALIARTADPVGDANPELAPLLPGRLNLWKALASPPEEAPGLVLPELVVRTADGQERRRWRRGDTLWLWVRAQNVLGSGFAVTCRLTRAADTGEALQLLDTSVTIPVLQAQTVVELGPFRARVLRSGTDPLLLRAECHDSGGIYRQSLFLPLTPTPDVATFASAAAAVSLSDDGALGFSDYPANTRGIGFRYREFCGLLYSGGLFAADSLRGRAVGSTPSGFTRDRDFTVLKPFLEPEQRSNLLSDAQAPSERRVGLLVRHDVLGFDAESSGVVRMLVTAWNVSGMVLSGVSLGFLMDWDLGRAGRGDRARFFPEARLPDIELPHGAEVIEHPGMPSVGACVVALTPRAEIQCAGFSTRVLYDGDGFSPAEKIRFLTSGTSVQEPDTGDVALIVGVRFTEAWLPEQPRQFLLCFGAAPSSSALAEHFHECVRYARELSVAVSPPVSLPRLRVQDGLLQAEVPHEGLWRIELWDLLGGLLWYGERWLPAGSCSFGLPTLSTGVVLLRLRSGQSFWQQLLLVP